MVHYKRVVSRSFDLAPGILRFSAARFRTQKGKKTAAPAKAKGAKDGKKAPKKVNQKWPTLQASAAKFKRGSPKRVPLRKSLVPGTILIVLAGRHKGKRVIFLKQLQKSGLLLCTGPHSLNSFPLRRIAQAFVIATSTRVDVSGVKIPDHINDDYFKRKTVVAKKGEDIFASGKTEYKVNEQRKTDQKAVDANILAAIKKHSDAKQLQGYLASRFGIRKGQLPHQIKF
ncbi:hypothetical protein WR25_12959 [Diploscapter pachys]|uniref:Large ribosomal subunit protein eL6 n=1 Tax=Diploscapter pachys TaxID=2018661 RepID=A0A2A2K371_9BILA|nr:hypothetical protein WR25_12959 [Diploscapter pachys]